MDSRFLMTCKSQWPARRRSAQCPTVPASRHRSRAATSRALACAEKCCPVAAIGRCCAETASSSSTCASRSRPDDGALIYMTSFGLRHGPPEVIAALTRGESVDPSTYYFRTTPRFETGNPKYAFLNRLLAVSSGDRRAEGPIYTIDEIL